MTEGGAEQDPVATRGRRWALPVAVLPAIAPASFCSVVEDVAAGDVGARGGRGRRRRARGRCRGRVQRRGREAGDPLGPVGRALPGAGDPEGLGVGSDERIGHAFLFPGVGYGGSCFPKDVDALIHTAQETGLGLRTLRASAEVNRDQQGVLAQKIQKCFAKKGDSLAGKTIAVWGLAFKPRTDDMREAPALRIIADLVRAGAHVRAFDPVANGNAKKMFEELGLKVSIVQSAYEAPKGAHALAIVTEWNEFRLPDLARLKELMAAHHIFDGRNILDPKEVIDMGFTYEGIGRRA